MIYAKFLLHNPGACRRNESKTLRMHLLNIVPPHWLMIILFDHLVDTMLSEILVNDIFTLNFMELVFDVIWSTVKTITEALILLEVSRASRTSPRHKTRRYINISLQLVCISIKLFDEVE